MSTRQALSKTSSAKQVKKKPRRPQLSPPGVKEQPPEAETSHVEDTAAKSRERLLLLLDEKLQSEDIAAELETQLRAKDTLIEQLNARLVTVAAQSQRVEYDSLSAKEKQVKTLLEEKTALARRIHTLEQKAIEAETNLRMSEDARNDERMQLELLNEALTEETEVLKAQVKEKAEQLRAAKGDILTLSKIVQDLNRLNSELNEKIASLNEEMEKNNKEHYLATKKAEQVEQVETELIQAKTDLQQAQAKTEKALAQAEEAREARELIYRVGKELDGAVTTLSRIESEECRGLVGTLDALVADMRKASTVPREESPEKVASLKAQIKALRAEVEEQKHLAARALASEQTHRTRVDSLTAEFEQSKQRLRENIDSLRQRLEPMQDTLDKGVAARQDLEGRLENSNSELQRKATEVVHLTEKAKSLKARLEQAKKAEEDSRKAEKEAKGELTLTQRKLAELEEKNGVREMKLKDTLSKLTSATDELWRRDNDILRRETQRLKLVEELTSLKSSVQHSKLRLKFKAAEEQGHINSQLEEKEKEINALKRMLQTKSGSADAQPLSQKEYLTMLEITDKLDQAIRRLKVLRDIADSEDAGNARKKAFAIVRSLQSELKQYRGAALPENAVQDADHLKALRATMSAQSVTVGDVIDAAVGLVS